ncbi:hypothetical protein IV203_021741 [Nitzschia inconspicua]|uniref:HIT-type domain-containing protein n=1 Tax=Nitzschia inconspicua TaxID=303405 RepID=A0A9K3KHB5_9STRA|nr:hypothetical protein IV203_021741 [Nitzschia inconspicua]
METVKTTAQTTTHDCGCPRKKKRSLEEATKEEQSPTRDSGNNDNNNVPSNRHVDGSSFQRRRQQSVRNNGRNRQQHAAASVSTVVPVCSVCFVSNNNATEDDQHNKEEDTKKERPKYKCPKCRALYCSVVCCRKHKQICPGIPPPPPQVDEKESSRTEQDSDGDNQNSSDDVDDDDDESLEDGWKITDEMKQALHNSSWLRNELKNNSGLRTIMKDIVKRSKQKTQRMTQLRNNNNNRVGNIHTHRRRHQYKNNDDSAHEILLDKRRNHSDFDEFCDKLLVLAGVLERQDPDNTTSGTGTGNFSSNAHEMEEWLQQQKWNHHPNLQPPPVLVMKPLVKKRTAIPKFEPVDVSSSSTTDDDDDDSDTDAASTTDSNNNSTGNGDS